MVKLALELGDPASARQAICQGLRALPGNEPIYRARMQIEHALGNIDGVNSAMRELASVLLGAADDGFDSTRHRRPSICIVVSTRVVNSGTPHRPRPATMDDALEARSQRAFDHVR